MISRPLSLISAILVFAATIVAPLAFGAPAQAATCPCSLWSASVTPGTDDSGDGAAVEVGLQFSSDTAGYLKGLRYYKSAANTGTHVGSLWTSTGTLLARTIFTSETSSGWQQAAFPAPVPVTAGATYVISYHTPTGHYAVDQNYFANPLDTAPLHVPASTSSSPNGLFTYSAVPTFPTGTFNGSNYWVDPVFDTQAPNGNPAPAVTSTVPSDGATGVAPSTAITATFNVPVQPSSVAMSLTGPSGAIAGTTTYDVASQTARFSPAGALSGGQSFTATVFAAQDLYGTPLASSSQWTFTTTSTTSACPCTLWPASATPGTIDAGDIGSVELGTRFVSDSDGVVTGLRFYKSLANTGPHVGSLWTADGTLLSQVTFTGESDSGWQDASFSPAVSITTGTIYVISYHTTTGHYSADPGYFSATYDAPPLHAPGGPGVANGVFAYGASALFPVNTFNANNYWVTPVFAPGRVLSSIAVTPSPASVAAGLTTSLTATGTYSDASTQTLTTGVTWTSSDTAKATVSSTGVVTGKATGSATIIATLGTISGSSTLAVTPAVLSSIAVTPSTPSVASGLTTSLTATGTYSDGSTQPLTTGVTWSSSDPAKATVSSTGVVTGKATGSATITAAAGTIKGTSAVTVTPAVLSSIAVTPSAVSVSTGLTTTLTAIGTNSDGSTQTLTTGVTWSSSDPAKATVSSTGVVTGKATGTATITATAGTISGSSVVTVGPVVLSSIAVTPSAASVVAGLTTTLTATGTYSDGSTQTLTTGVTWSSSDTAKATVASTGVVTGKATGTATITAAVGTIKGTSAVTVTAAVLSSLAVTPPQASVAAGLTTSLTATGTYSDGSTRPLTTGVTWTSSDPAKATVASTGVVTGRATGTATITAAVGTIKGTGTVNVTPAVLSSIAVKPSPATVIAGLTTALTATGTYSDGSTLPLTTGVTWTSSDTTRATVSSTGVVTGKAAGTSTITAAVGTIKGTSTMTVKTIKSLQVTPSSVVARVLGPAVQLTATAVLNDGTTADLTTRASWVSTLPLIAPVSSTGLVKGNLIGLTTVRATVAGVTDSALVTVLL